jgi:hypothetical protein
MRPDVADAGYLWDMLHYSRAIVQAVKGRTLDDYRADEDFRLAV